LAREIRFVFVDEYQDINAAQDQIIAALSRDGAEANRFLVGDVKQSIYRFRLADPGIFAATPGTGATRSDKPFRSLRISAAARRSWNSSTPSSRH